MTDAALFHGERLAGYELAPADAPAVQRLYEATPSYFRIVLGEDPAPDAARETFERRPPPDMPFTRKRVIGLREAAHGLVAVADVIEDLLAPRVWHLGLFLVPERLQGTGLALRAYDALESWVRSSGARWLRLGAVRGNDRAERFWRARGYCEIRRRTGVEMGRRVNELLVMVKPLADAPLAEYLELVPRDRPEGAPTG